MIMQKFYRLAALASVSLCSLAGVVPTAHAYETVSGGRYGQVTVTKPTGDVRGFVVLFSRESGWNPADQQAADALAKNGAMVVGVDTAKYAANLAAKKEACHQLVGDAEAVSHQLERQVQSNRYFMPIVAGSGQGATLAMQVLKQAPENTVAGAVSVAAQRDLDKRFNPCAPDPTVTHGPGLPGFAETDANASAGTQRIVELTTPHLRVAAMKEEDVSDLPLIELPAAHPTGMMAIVISGDGGWRDLDKTIAEELQKDGVSVIGWDSLRYFWSERSPQQTSNDLARAENLYDALACGSCRADWLFIRRRRDAVRVQPLARCGARQSLADFTAWLRALGRLPDSRDGLARHACKRQGAAGAARVRAPAAEDRAVLLRRA